MNVDNNLVMVGIALRDGHILTQFVNSRDEVTRSLYQAGQLAEPGLVIKAGHRVDHNRDAIAEAFMSHPQCPDWLLFLDADMDFPPAIGQRLSAWQKPLVGGLYFQRGNWFPMAFRYRERVRNRWGKWEHRWDWADTAVNEYLIRHNVPMQEGHYTVDDTSDALTECDAIASGAMLIHRSLLAAMRPPWFEITDGTQTDDFQFCYRVKQELRLSIYCDFSTICGHLCVMSTGHKEFRETMARQGYIDAREA